ncbi:hypothetical protein OHA77_27465 [Streptosporangium sp. NBC_01639]|uniref:hypothetical protein n=1 Tax=Streptosporangium sp. NBC_01639 TaxID=2975948 RepID=UPI00386A7877|nr:hypothetical protein OHA77_27465 [Streptosporangium sp. NBC_01639]
MTTEPTGPPPTVRRPELDAIRTLVVVGLVFFHSALVFDTRDDYYVKNADTTEVTTILAGLGVVWAMPMLFLIAGLGSWYSLRRRGPAGSATGWPARRSGAARYCCLPSRSRRSARWRAWRRGSPPGAAGRTCSSSCTASCSRPTSGSSRPPPPGAGHRAGSGGQP